MCSLLGIYFLNICNEYEVLKMEAKMNVIAIVAFITLGLIGVVGIFIARKDSHK